ncbi:hypothetical protein ANCDUO_18036, partial [Ancylostoma duodenale]
MEMRPHDGGFIALLSPRHIDMTGGDRNEGCRGPWMGNINSRDVLLQTCPFEGCYPPLLHARCHPSTPFLAG